jgi:hypothetical protein
MQCQSYAQSVAMHDARPDQRLGGRAGRAPPAARRGGGRADGEGPQKRWLRTKFLFFYAINAPKLSVNTHGDWQQEGLALGRFDSDSASPSVAHWPVTVSSRVGVVVLVKHLSVTGA